MNYKLHKDVKQKVHYNGNSLKSLHHSIRDSLKKLRTDYIDIFYLHWVSTSGSVIDREVTKDYSGIGILLLRKSWTVCIISFCLGRFSIS